MAHPAHEILAKVLADGIREASERSNSAQPKDVQARVLLDMLPAVTRPNPFKVGDLVEQTEAYARYKSGLAIVSAIGPENDTEQDGSVARMDMRVLTFVNNTWVEFPVESWRFHKYEGPIS